MSTEDRGSSIEPERLARFLGEWTVDGTLVSGESDAAIVGRWSFAEILDGMGVEGSMATSIEGWGTFAESELIVVDDATDSIHLFSANRFAVRDHIGGWTDESTLVVTYRSGVGEVEVVETIAIEFSAPDTIEARVVETAGGAPSLTTDLKMTRRAEPVAEG